MHERSTALPAGLNACFALAAIPIALFVICGVVDHARAEGRYNVLFIAVDDLRPELGCYGAGHIKSPHIDRLASGGTTFNRAYCQQAVCSPSRTSLLTGRRPDTTRVFDLQTHFRMTIPDVVTLPQHFKQQGYHAQSMGKIYHGGLDDPKSWSVEHWTPDVATYHKPESRAILKARQDELRASGRLRRNEVVEKDPDTGMPLKLRRVGQRALGPSWEDPDVPDSALSDGAIADHAIEVLGGIKDKRFFLAVGFHKPHLPFIAPAKYFETYPPAGVSLSPNRFPPLAVPQIALSNWGELRGYADVPGQGPLTNDHARDLVRAYYACVSYVDAQVGRVLDELDRLGLRDNTIVILWGDHGWHLGDQGMWCKHTNFEVATRAPMIIRVPGQPAAGAKTNALAEFVDIYPTLCDLCDLSMPDGLEGTSLAPVIEVPDRPWKTAAFSQYPRGEVMGRSIRTDRYRYTEWAEPDKEPVGIELYDYEQDPHETVNLASWPHMADTAKALKGRLRAGWREAMPK